MIGLYAVNLALYPAGIGLLVGGAVEAVRTLRQRRHRRQVAAAYTVTAIEREAAIAAGHAAEASRRTQSIHYSRQETTALLKEEYPHVR